MSRAGSIPAAWMAITGVMSAEPHLALLDEVDRMGVAHDDLKSVRRIWLMMSRKASERLEKLDLDAKARHDSALADARERDRLLQQFPALRRSR
jgi:hypothetical protein